MKIHLGGHLSFYDAQKRSAVEMQFAEPIRLSDLAQRLGLPHGEVVLVAVNGAVILDQDALVSDTDRVEFFSPIGGGAISS